MLGAYAAGAVASVLAWRSAAAGRLLGHLGALTGAVLGIVVAAGVLGGPGGAPLQLAGPRLFPFVTMSLSLDGLGAYFLLVVSLVAAAAAIYGPAYLRAHPSGSPVVHGLGLNVFIGSMALVCLAGDAVTFLFAWEGMTLASYALVVSDGSDENGHAGLLYVVMAHAGTALLMVVFLLLSERAGSFDFAALRTAAR